MTRSNAAGAFSFAKTTKLSLITAMGDRLDRWTLCVDTESGKRIVWNDDGMWGGPVAEEISCTVEPPACVVVRRQLLEKRD